MKPKELRSAIENAWSVDFDRKTGDVRIVNPGKPWMVRTACNIFDMAEELERLRILSPISPADVVRGDK